MSNIKKDDAGRVLADTLRSFLYDLEVEDGLSAVGYTKEDIPSLVKGTIPQVNISRHIAVLKNTTEIIFCWKMKFCSIKNHPSSLITKKYDHLKGWTPSAKVTV